MSSRATIQPGSRGPGRRGAARGWRAAITTAVWTASLTALGACDGVDRPEHGATSAPPTLSVVQALGPALEDDRYARALAPRAFHFPDDHGPHPAFRSEWWYWTGNLDGPGGRRFGYQLTVFRNALAPGAPDDRTSAWATNQFFLAHFALTDVATGAFYAFERASRAALGLAGASARPFRAWVLDWTATGSNDADAGANADAMPIHLRVAAEGPIALELSLSAGKALVLEGDRGLSQKGSAPGNASYYYSLTRMPTEGRITVLGRSFPVRGESWMDREWSTSALESGQVGWDWFSLQLSDGRELMFYRLRARNGSAHAMSGGTLVDAAGNVRRLTREQVALQPTGTWTSVRSGATYPAGFRLRVPDAGLDLRITPVVAAQELDLTFRYWEGAVDISGTAIGATGTVPIAGRGYLELTGYGEESPPPNSPPRP